MGVAANEGRVEVLPLLLEAGAGVDVQNKVGWRGGCRGGGRQGWESYPGSMVMTMHPARRRLTASAPSLCLPNRTDGRP